MEGNSFLSQNKWAIWLIIVSLVVIAGVAFFIFRSPGAPPNPKVTLSIDAPGQAASGSEVVYRVQFANNDVDPINNVTLDMLYPQGFNFTESDPQPSKLDGTEFLIPNLSPGQSSQIVIKGNLNGNSGEAKAISGVLHYKFSNFNGDFVAQAQSRSQITNSNIILQFSGPAQTNNDQTLTYDLSYSNSSSSPLSGMSIQLNIPPSFIITSYSPNPDITAQNIWALPTLQSGAGGTIVITGRFSSAPIGNQQAFSASASGRDANGQAITYSNASFLVSINANPLEADLSVLDNTRGGNASQNVVQPGDVLTYTVHYKNNNTISMTGVNLAVVLSGDAFDLSSVNAQNALVNGNNITWSAAQSSGLASLQPNQEGNFTFQITLKNPATNSNAQNLTVNAHAEIKSSEIQQPFVSSSLSLKVITVPTIDTAISYSAGAHPPKVNQSTTYQVTLNLRNSTNDLTNGVLTLNLPNSLGFDKTSITFAEIQNVTYNANTRKLTWNVGTLPAHTGDFQALRTLQFSVTVTPDPSKVGQAMVIANNIQLTGNDSFTASSVTKSAQDLSTIADPSGQGIVTQ